MTLCGRRQALFASFSLLAGVAFPCVLRAQAKSARIGVLGSSSRTSARPNISNLWTALAEMGWVDGRNLRLDERYADGDLARHDALAAELVALRPDIIVAPTQPAAVAAMKATRTIPIVFVIVPEPVESGLAETLARPGKNATGLATLNMDLVAKRVQLMSEAFPGARRVAILYQPDFDMNRHQAALAEAAAKTVGFEILRIGIGLPQTFDSAFGELARQRPDAVLVIENPAVFTHRAEVVRRMAQTRIPTIYGLQEFTLAGGLISYSVHFPDQYRRAADYVNRILGGARPGELPIQQPLRFELTVNLAAARNLGIALPQSILLRADRIIE